jgi:hypothetical protein
MPLNTTPSGLSVRVPGVYVAEEVIKSTPGPLPEFNVPIVMVGAEEGYPYNVKDSRQITESITQWQLCNTPSKVRSVYGQDSEAGIIAKYLWRHGFPQGYFVCLSALTRGQIIATSAGPINQLVIYGRKYGWPANWIKLSWASLTLVIQPPQNYSRLTASSASASNKVYVRDNSWVSVGMTLEIGDNDSPNVTKVVDGVGTEIDANGQLAPWIRFTATVGAVYTTAQYAAVAVYSPTLKESPDAFADLEEAFQYLQNDSKYLFATKHAAFTNATLISVASLTCLKDITAWSSVTLGVSPTPTASDVANFITDMDESEWEAFILDMQKIPHAFYVGLSSSTAHASMRDWATAKRILGPDEAISVTSGAGWGDVVLAAGDDTDPLFRLAALNSQDFMLAIAGMDRLAAYLTKGPAVFAHRVGNAIPHNLTNDELVCESHEVMWDEINSGELTTLLDRGALTHRLNPSLKRFVIAQGLLTLQQNDEAWNEVGASTPLAMQRDNADFVDRIIAEEFEIIQIGADKVTAASVAGVLRRKAEKLLLKRGLVTDWGINSVTINDTATGWDVDWYVKLHVTTDYINVTTKILVG